MNALLDQVVTANGGTDRWNDITSITAEVTFGGPFWEFKGQPGFASTELVEASARGEFIDFSPTAHYVREETEVDSVTVPTERHVHIRNQDRSADLSWIPITLDLTDIRFH